jgi:hypothetical protein
MAMATMRRVVIYYLLLELNHDTGNNESSNLLLTNGVINYCSLYCGHCHDLAPVVSNKLILSSLWSLLRFSSNSK